jgi:HK97 family phage major capsid protein
MAVTAATKTTDFSGFLTPEMASPIFEKAYKTSVVQQLAQKVPLGPNGVTVPVVSGRMSAGWVAEPEEARHDRRRVRRGAARQSRRLHAADLQPDR